MRSVVVDLALTPSLLRALCDVRSGINRLLPDWVAHPEESRFEASKRSYPELRRRYSHLASSWIVVMCNEASATRNAWKGALRRARRLDPSKYERMKTAIPRRTRLKASLHRGLYRFREGVLDVTIAPDRHVSVDLSGVRNPLFARYLAMSRGDFGLAATDRGLVFNFNVPRHQPLQVQSTGVDLNMGTLDYATSDGVSGSVDLRPVSRIQRAMERKRLAVQRHIPRDLRQQRRVLRRLRGRERHRTKALLHTAVNSLLGKAGERNIILEDLAEIRADLMKEVRAKKSRRRISSWTQGAVRRIIEYKSKNAVVCVNPKGTSSECPRCGGPLDHPSWRRATCGNCEGEWHRDRAAAISVLRRGHAVLRGSALTQSALNALLKAARWRAQTRPTGELMKGDEANEQIGVVGH